MEKKTETPNHGESTQTIMENEMETGIIGLMLLALWFWYPLA